MGLQLAAHKSEAIVFTKKRKHNEMTITMDAADIDESNSVKYLGLRLDSKLNFINHAKEAATKAGKATQKIGRILPNIRAATPRKRRLLSNVTHSLLLYGAPAWADRMSTSGITQLLKVQRRIALRVASLYRVVSLEAAHVLANIPLVDLLAKERKEIHESSSALDHGLAVRAEAKSNLMEKWQKRWDETPSCRWTYKLIHNLPKWHERKHGELCYHLAQAFSGHGCFAKYLHKFGKIDSLECWLCGNLEDDAFHTIFECDAWHDKRRRLTHAVGYEINPDNIVETMLKSIEHWNQVHGYIKEVLEKKEAEERMRQQQQQQ